MSSSRIALPNHKDIIVDQCCDDAPEREHALVAIREAFAAARRQIEDAERRMHDSIKLYAPVNRGPVAKVIETRRSLSIDAAEAKLSLNESTTGAAVSETRP